MNWEEESERTGGNSPVYGLGSLKVRQGKGQRERRKIGESGIMEAKEKYISRNQ